MILVQTKNLVSLRRLLVTMHMRPELGSKSAIASYPGYTTEVTRG